MSGPFLQDLYSTLYKNDGTNTTVGYRYKAVGATVIDRQGTLDRMEAWNVRARGTIVSFQGFIASASRFPLSCNLTSVPYAVPILTVVIISSAKMI